MTKFNLRNDIIREEKKYHNGTWFNLTIKGIDGLVMVGWQNGDFFCENYENGFAWKITGDERQRLKKWAERRIK